MKRKRILLSVGSALILLSVGTLTSCGDSSDSSSYSSSAYDNSNSYSSSSYDDSSSYNSSSYDDSNSYNDYNSSTYSSSSSGGSEGYGYDKSDPFYSANDVDGDGKLTDEEWQNAMSDAIDYYYNQMQEGN